MNFITETQGSNTFLVYEIGKEDVIDSMSLGMLTNNKISGLAGAIFTQMNMTKYIKYNISSKISVKQLFNGIVNKKRLMGVLNGIVNAMISAEDYMINAESIVLDLEYMYTDVSTFETVLICVPVEGYKNNENIGDFIKQIMVNTKTDPSENCNYVAKIINYLNSTPVISLEAFRDVFVDCMSNDDVETTQNNVSRPAEGVITEQPKVVEQPISPNRDNVVKTENRQPSVPVQNVRGNNNSINIPNNPQQPVINAAPTEPEKKKTGFFGKLFQKDASKSKPQQLKKESKSKNAPAYAVPGMNNSSMAIPGMEEPINSNISNQNSVNVVNVNVNRSNSVRKPQCREADFGETTLLTLNGNGETTVLNASVQSVQVTPHLIRSKNNERIPVNKSEFKIGKERSYADYFIGDNTAISRSHANIVSRGHEFFIVDTNSKNHVFVNGAMIQSGIEVKINHGDKITLANEDFEFKLH